MGATEADTIDELMKLLAAAKADEADARGRLDIAVGRDEELRAAELVIAEIKRLEVREALHEVLATSKHDPPREWTVTCTFTVPIGKLSRSDAHEVARQRIVQLHRILPVPGKYVLRCDATDEKEFPVPFEMMEIPAPIDN